MIFQNKHLCIGEEWGGTAAIWQMFLILNAVILTTNSAPKVISMQVTKIGLAL